MLVIPAVDVLDGKVVRLEQGDYERVTVYGPDPVAAARRWLDEGAAFVHVVDLEGARSGAPDSSLWGRCAAAGIPFQVGGGLRNEATAAAALDAGAMRVVLGTAAVWDPPLVAGLIGRFGPERVAVSVDVKQGRAAGRGWRERGRPLDEVVDAVTAAGATWLVATSISRDGTGHGPDLELVASMRSQLPTATLVAAGGVATTADLTALVDAGADGAIVGRALYDGSLRLADVPSSPG